MSTAISERKAFSIEPITYPVLADKINELAAEYMPLRIDGLEDKKGLKAVHDARMAVKNLRVNVDKRRKELKAASLEYGRQVDSAAKSLTDLLEPIEDHLQAEEDAVEQEKARIAKEAAEAARIKLQNRLSAMLAYGREITVSAAEQMSDDRFAEELERAKIEHDLKLRAEQEAAERRKAEEAALAAERAELDRLRKEQEAEAARIRAEQQKLEAEKEAQRRAAELEKAKAEAAERARVETEQRIAREQEQARLAAERKAAQEKADAEAKEAARLKAEAERPQREKLLAVAVAVEQIGVPTGPGCEAVKAELNRCAAQIRKFANGPLE